MDDQRCRMFCMRVLQVAGSTAPMRSKPTPILIPEVCHGQTRSDSAVRLVRLRRTFRAQPSALESTVSRRGFSLVDSGKPKVLRLLSLRVSPLRQTIACSLSRHWDEGSNAVWYMWVAIKSILTSSGTGFMNDLRSADAGNGSRRSI